MKIIGLTGPIACGKGIVANILKEKGYEYFSLSNAVREEAKKRNIEETRENLIALGNKLREERGKGVLAEITLDKIKNSNKERFVIDSIRNPAEVEVFRKQQNFFLIGIDASQETRLKRMLERAKESDPKSIEELEQADEKDKAIGIDSCLEKSDYLIQNEKDIEYLSSEVSKVLDKIDYQRPSWDEYFMNIARVIGQRGTCDRGRNGAIIVKDKRIISTGYVGSPVGLPHCDDVGHMMHSVNNPDGSVSKHCIRTAHAEQNAIVQAALHGVSTKGATMYCKLEPCFTCCKMIINAGIKRVVCQKRYHKGGYTREFFKQAGVELVALSKEIEDYPNQA